MAAACPPNAPIQLGTSNTCYSVCPGLTYLDSLTNTCKNTNCIVA